MEKEKGNLKGAFVERDLSWMYFNHRILQEAEKESVPLIDRLSFLGIYSNNLDEFFRVRMASLNRIALSKDKNIKQDRERAKKTIKDINHLNACYNKEFERAVEDITKELEKQGIRLLHETELNDEQQKFIRQFYLDKLNGSTNPVWLSQVKEIGATGDDSMPKELLRRIMSRLNIDTLDTIVSGGRYQNHKDLMAFPDCGRSDLEAYASQYSGIIIVGSGGNINKLSRLFHESNKKSRHNTLPVRNLQQIHDEMRPLTINERISRYNLKPDRADVIIPAAEIFLNVANALKCTEIHVPNISLADGIIDGLYQRCALKQKD